MRHNLMIGVAMAVVCGSSCEALAQSDPAEDAPRYATHTLREWLVILKNDLDPETRIKALDAIQTFHFSKHDPQKLGFDAVRECFARDKAWNVRLRALQSLDRYALDEPRRGLNAFFETIRSRPMPAHKLRKRPPDHPTDVDVIYPTKEHRQAIDALRFMNSTAAPDFLARCATLFEEDDVGNKMFACHVARRHVRVADGMSLLARASRDESVYVREVAVQLIGHALVDLSNQWVSARFNRSSRTEEAKQKILALVTTKREIATKALISRLQDKRIHVRIMAARAGLPLDSQANKFLPALIAALDIQTADVQYAIGHDQDPAEIWKQMDNPREHDAFVYDRDGKFRPTRYLTAGLLYSIAIHGSDASAAKKLIQQLASKPTGFVELDQDLKTALRAIEEKKEAARPGRRSSYMAGPPGRYRSQLWRKLNRFR